MAAAAVSKPMQCCGSRLAPCCFDNCDVQSRKSFCFALTQARAAAKVVSEKSDSENATGAPHPGPPWLSRKSIMERKGSQSAQAKLGNDLAAALGRLRGIIRPTEDGGDGGSPHRSW